MQPEPAESCHSELRNGFLRDCSITLIDKTDDSDLQDFFYLPTLFARINMTN